MTELEKIAYAKSFIDKLANGINPLDDSPVAEYDVVNNVRLKKCFSFVSDVLRQVIENGGTAPKAGGKKAPFSLTPEQLSRFEFSNLPIPVTEIARRINALVDADAKEKLSYNYITSWLVSIGALAVEFDADGTKHKVPTEYGKRLGISPETRTWEQREYQAVVYNRDAQAFIIDNMNAILSFIGGTTRT